MKVEAPFIHLIKLHTKYYLYDVNSKMIVNISNDLFDFFKSNENIKAEIEIPHKLEDEVRRLLKYDLFSKTDTGYEIEYPQGTNLEEILNNCMRIMTLQVTQNCNLPHGVLLNLCKLLITKTGIKGHIFLTSFIPCSII